MTDNRKGKGGKAGDDLQKAAYSACHDSKTDENSLFTPAREIRTDTLEFPYQSVRFCDLDRFCDK
jgi:hypothetical protein